MKDNFDATTVGVGKGNPIGYAWVAPKGTKLPIDAKEALSDEFVSMGYVSDAGVAQSSESESKEIKDWAGRVVKKVTTSFSETYEVGFLQTEEKTLKVNYGDANVSSDGKGGITVKHNGAFDDERVYVFETLITETLIQRTVIPRGVINEKEGMEYTSENEVVYKVKITALADAEGNTSYDYFYNVAADAGLEG